MKKQERQPPLVDAAAREAIRTHLNVTMMVEAAAGTGKTTSLVERMIALIRTGSCRVETLAAITFTVKAASHLRERFHEALQKELTTLSDADELQRVAEAISRIERCFIGTTHAFCARLLRERPVEAAIDPEFEELDENEARLLTHQFFGQMLERAAAVGDERLPLLREVGLPAPKLKDSFLKLTHFPDVTVHFEETPQPDLNYAFEALGDFLDRIENDLPTDAMREKQDPFEVLIRALLQHRRSRDFDDWSAKAELLDDADHKSRKPTQKNWADKKRAKEWGEEYLELVTGTIHPALLAWREYVHGIVVGFLQPAIEEFARQRRRNGTLTFEDLLLCARDLLRDHPNVRKYFQRRFTHLLVDEFQDTDPLQAEVMFYLTGSDVEEKSWRRLRPQAGSLFIVGDPKQSIYRFRRADITTYLEVRERIVESGGEVLQLSTNFRSLPVICDWVNTNFATMFSGADVEEKRQAAHVPLEAHRVGSALSGTYLLETVATTSDELARTEAECLAGWIRRAVDAGTLIDDRETVRPMEWRDVLLVSWHRPRLSFYARALEAAGIPYEVTGGKAFAGSEELQSILPILHVLIDPDHSVSFAAFLRGPLCGVDDQALYDFARAGGRFTLYSAIPEGTDSRIEAAFDILRQASSEAHLLPPAATLARLFDRLGLLALAASKEQGATRSGNLLLALAYARKISSRGESLAVVADELETMLDPQSDIEGLDLDPARSNSVRLMNLHQVKGLEAPIVFLIEPNEPFVHPVDSFIDRSGEESIGYFALFRKQRYKDRPIALPKGWDALAERERSYKEAERNRALYVAATRARNMLVVGRRRKGERTEGAWRNYPTQPSEALPQIEESKKQSGVSALSFDFPAAKATLHSSYLHSREASYSVLPITKLAKSNHAELLKHEEGLGKGTSWGRVMHRLLEAMLRKPGLNVRLHAANLLKDEERDAAELSEVLAAIDAIEASPLWARAKKASRCLVEVPFALEVEARSVGLEEPGKTLLHGTIDLVFREKEGWIVIDYKSDIVGGRLAHLVSYYRPQVEHYARFWGELTGEPTRGGLFFIDGAREVWL